MLIVLYHLLSINFFVTIVHHFISIVKFGENYAHPNRRLFAIH
jgi:hypothetical protein